MKKIIPGVLGITIVLLQLCFGVDDLVPVWTKTFSGSTLSAFREGSGVAVDSSGNVYVTGTDADDIWTRKYDENGKVLWTKTYNGASNLVDKGIGIAVDSSGNVYVTGYETVLGEWWNIWTRKYDSDGNTIWTRTHSGIPNGADRGIGIAVDGSGNVYVTGCEGGAVSSSLIWTRKYDSNGNTLWTKTTDGGYGLGIVVDRSGNVYISAAGSEVVYPHGTNILIRKYDSNGNEIWTKKYDGVGYGDDSGWGIAVDDSGNIFVTGSTRIDPTFDDIWTRKCDSSGNELWTKIKKGVTGGYNRGRGITLDSAGNAYVTGTTYVSGHENDIWIAKYDGAGVEVWEKTYNGTENGGDVGNGIAIDSGGSVYFTGASASAGNSIIVTRKYSKAGANVGTSSYLKIVGGKEGFVNPSRGEVANFVYRTNIAGAVIFKIYNAKGELVKTASVPASGLTQSDSFNYDCKNEDGNYLSSGIYIVKAEGPGLSLVKKLAIMK